VEAGLEITKYSKCRYLTYGERFEMLEWLRNGAISFRKVRDIGSGRVLLQKLTCQKLGKVCHEGLWTISIYCKRYVPDMAANAVCILQIHQIRDKYTAALTLLLLSAS
jgi:hypothetical protein